MVSWEQFIKIALDYICAGTGKVQEHLIMESQYAQ